MSLKLQKKEIRGLQTSFLEANPQGKEVLFFMHGFPDSAEAWTPLIEELAKDYHCIAPFARGLEQSPLADGNKDRLTLDAQMLDALEILKTQKAIDKKIHLVCHDLGAVPAWKLTHLLGKKASTLTVINGLSLKQFLRRLMNPQQIMKSWYIWLFQVPGVMETFIKKNPMFVLKKAASMGGRSVESFNVNDLKNFELYRQYLKETPTEIKNSSKVKAKVLSLNSLEDAFLLPTTIDELEKDCNYCEARILQSNHWVHHENPKLVAELIQKFIGNKNVELKSTPEVGL